MQSTQNNIVTTKKPPIKQQPYVWISIHASVSYSSPRAGSGVVRIDSLRFLVGCCTRWL